MILRMNRKMSEPRFTRLADFLDFKIQLNIVLFPKSRESYNPGPIPVQTGVNEGGLGKFYQLFGLESEKIINEINSELAA